MYFATWTRGVDPEYQTVEFETTDPDAETSAHYLYLGQGGSAPVYIWDEPPYTFSGYDTPGKITVTVSKDGYRNTYTVYVNGIFS